MTSTTAPLLDERYQLEQMLAAGGMGEVWRGLDTLLDRPVAVKVPRPELRHDPAFAERLLTEARHSAAVVHPGIAAVYDVGAEGPLPFLVMELVEGRSLSRLLTEEGPLDAERARHVVCQVAAALAAAHDAGLVHRDVKPANLLVTDDDTVKVTDFGIARAVDAAAVTRTGFVLGTAQYLSPEQTRGRPASAASDVYALGVVAFECLAGRRPFDGEPLAVLRAHADSPVPTLPAGVPADLADLVRSLLAKDPKQRPTARQVVGDDPWSRAGQPGAAPATVPDEPSEAGPATAWWSTPAVAAAGPPVPALLDPEPAPEPEPEPASDGRPPSHPWTADGARTRLAAAAAASVVALLALALTSGTTSGEPEPSAEAAPSPAGVPADTPPDGPARVPVAAVQLFHPGGSGDDHPEELPLAVDGDPATAWTTQRYASPEFGSLRPGVGLLLDLGAPTAVGQARLDLAFPGVALRVHAGDTADPSLLDSTPVQVVPDAPAEVVVAPAQAVTARYWLVWIERLPESGRRHQAGVAEVVLTAP